MNPEKILYILISSFVKHKTNEYIAEELSCHRNTVSKYVNRFSDLKSDIILLADTNGDAVDSDLNKFCQSFEACIFIEQYIIRRKDRKCTDKIYSRIEACCNKYLNYCIFERDIYEFAEKTLNELAARASRKYGEKVGLVKSHVINYYDYGFSSYEYERLGFTTRKECVKYMKAICNIRNYNKIPKNYSKVYNEFCKSACYKTTPISYNTFYNYARQFWGKKQFKYRLIDVLTSRQ